MAECGTVPSNFKLQLQTKGSWFKPQNSYPKNFPSRNFRSASLPLWRVSKRSTMSVSVTFRTPVSSGSPMRCSCLGTMIDFESAAVSSWVPVIDQVLLTASVFFAYMAGVIPSGGSYIRSQKNKSNDLLLPESPIFFGSTTEKEDQHGCHCSWDAVKGKITKSLLAIENGVSVEENTKEYELDRAKRPLNLYAVAIGPRFRLLLSLVEQLEKMVNEIPDTSTAMEREEWLGLFSSTVKKACQSALFSWMEKEFSVENCKPDKELLLSMSEKLRGEDIILGDFRKSSKMDLFADLIGFFRYGCFKECSYYDHNLYPLHGGAILEDLIITLADAISSIYLEVISVDSDISEKISNFGLSLCTLSTRDLQKLRNEVAMREWIHQNFGEIVLMYEDRFDLRVLKTEPYRESAETLKESHSWWRRLTLKKSVHVQSSLRYSVVSTFSLTLKRTRELRALKGWKYYFSLILELSDIAVPMVKVIVSQVRNAISFFLVSLIGRSVGLVYTGIRQSLRWK
ncbi:uncharacterized protein LOC110728077 isoform X1 [Chenopodium quinoa]|uniref:uncharacterized protein LOC110728077 isoform X1 n=1 Tax=Chenopodium quinoa TaxID=63459 RepID=UPI000B77989E|nr:uncharacterized protein LOC110728077 isoform X1 [Chenopodium quinoa]XP_021763392.1 uncharacterized protein LOC110728077 isoform X1 [Chenopodium quinoa]XP_021763393.1 uncharacterized protein LOC110728077 isoform X1 [Chenopodium quinoa]